MFSSHGCNFLIILSLQKGNFAVPWVSNKIKIHSHWPPWVFAIIPEHPHLAYEDLACAPFKGWRFAAQCMCVLRSNALNEWLPHKAGYLGHGKQPKLSTGEGLTLTVSTDLIFNPLWFANFLLFLIITSLGPISPKVVWEGKKYTWKIQGWVSLAFFGSDSFQHETRTPFWTSVAGRLPCHCAVQVTWYGCANKDCQVRKSDVCQPQRRATERESAALHGAYMVGSYTATAVRILERGA